MKIKPSSCSSSHGRYWGWLFLAVVTVIFYVHNVLSPEYLDDYAYKFIFNDCGPDFSQRIHTLGDVLRSQYEFYFAWNGRTVIQLLGQLFCGLLGKPLFNVLNAIVFAVFIYLLNRQVAATGSLGACAYPLTVALVLMLPTFSETFLWVVGSLNYLWCSTGLLLFLLIYEKRRLMPVDKRLRPLWLLVFLLGWTHEGIVLPLAVTLVGLNVLSWRRSVATRGFWLAVVLLAGACMAAFAPSIIQRSGASHGFSRALLYWKVSPFLLVLSKLRLVYMALLMTIALAVVRRELAARVLKQNIHLVLAVVLSFGIVFMSGMPIARPAFGLEFFSLVYLLRLIGAVAPAWNPRVVKVSAALLTVALALFTGMMMSHVTSSWQETCRLVDQIEHTSDGIIATQEHDAGIFTSFVCTMIEKDTSDYATNYDPQTEPASIAMTYHRDSLIFLPKTLLDSLKANPGQDVRFDLNTPYSFYMERISAAMKIRGVRYHLKPFKSTFKSPLLQKVAYKISHYPDTIIPTHQWAVVNLYGSRYLIVNKINELSGRLTTIDVISDHPGDFSR